MKIAGLLTGLIIMTIMASYDTVRPTGMAISRTFEPNHELSKYINSFEHGKVDYIGLRSLIQPDEVRGVAVTLTQGETDIDKITSIHEFIKNKISYEPRFDYVNAEQILLDKRGDCSEMAILSVSLLESIGIESYITNSEGHLFAVARAGDYWVVVDPTQDFINSQFNWSVFEDAYLVNSTTTLVYASTTSASA